MTPQQRKTATFLLASLGAFVLWCLAALGWEAYTVTMGGHSTISEVIRLAFMAQPGAFVFVLVLVSLAAGGLLTHFVWAGKATYEQLKKDSEQ